jgi:hypothetical protein
VFDRIDLRDALASSTFTGTNAHEAFQQGYIYLVEHGTTVYMDRNGNAPDYGYQGDVALVNLEGVAADALRLGYCNGHFIA